MNLQFSVISQSMYPLDTKFGCSKQSFTSCEQLGIDKINSKRKMIDLVSKTAKAYWIDSLLNNPDHKYIDSHFMALLKRVVSCQGWKVVLFGLFSVQLFVNPKSPVCANGSPLFPQIHSHSQSTEPVSIAARQIWHKSFWRQISLNTCAQQSWHISQARVRRLPLPLTTDFLPSFLLDIPRLQCCRRPLLLRQHMFPAQHLYGFLHIRPHPRPLLKMQQHVHKPGMPRPRCLLGNRQLFVIHIRETFCRWQAILKC